MAAERLGTRHVRIRRVWRSKNLASGGGTLTWTYESARSHLELATRAGEFNWSATDPYQLDTAVQVDVLGWQIRSPWRNLMHSDG